MDSILNSVKKMLGIAADYKQFDIDLIIHINSVFAVLNQIGVGPESGFSIADDQSVWDDFTAKSPKLEFVKTLMYLKVRLLFDPPMSSAVLGSMDSTIKELEWRIQVAVEQEGGNTL